MRNVWRYEQGITAKSMLSAVVIALRLVILIFQVRPGHPLEESCCSLGEGWQNPKRAGYKIQGRVCSKFYFNCNISHLICCGKISWNWVKLIWGTVEGQDRLYQSLQIFDALLEHVDYRKKWLPASFLTARGTSYQIHSPDVPWTPSHWNPSQSLHQEGTCPAAPDLSAGQNSEFWERLALTKVGGARISQLFQARAVPCQANHYIWSSLITTYYSYTRN